MKFCSYPSRSAFSTIPTVNGERAENDFKIATVSSVDPSSHTTSSRGFTVWEERLLNCSPRYRAPLNVVMATEIHEFDIKHPSFRFASRLPRQKSRQSITSFDRPWTNAD